MNRARAGFTIVELAVVLFILAVTFSILLPRLPGLSATKKNSALRRLARDIQATYEDALFQKKTRYLIYRFEDNSYLPAAWDDEAQDFDFEGGPFSVKETRLPQGLRFRDVEVPQLQGMESGWDGRAYTPFLPQGYAMPSWIHLEDEDGAEYTIVVHPLFGRAEIFDGRIDAK